MYIYHWYGNINITTIDCIGFYCKCAIRYSVMASTVPSHGANPGSIPGIGASFIFCILHNFFYTVAHNIAFFIYLVDRLLFSKSVNKHKNIYTNWLTVICISCLRRLSFHIWRFMYITHLKQGKCYLHSGNVSRASFKCCCNDC